MATSNPEFPRRLAEGEDQAATLIARALAEPMPGPSEEQSWRKLRSRSARSTPRWALPAVAFGLSALALLVWLARPTVVPAVSLGPDVWAQRAATAPQAAPTALNAEKETEKPVQTEHAKSVAPAHEGDAGQCSQLAKAGQYAAASACYGKVAHGSSMDAELALYEKARLQAKALGQSAQALATLDEHAHRFPGGVLTTEVELTRIELLSQLGRRADALSAIERGLHGVLGRERAGDLQVLRAELLSAQGDCAGALEAVQAARQAGAHPSRLEATEHRCNQEAETP
jgi:tetratricopeptide (TPR) repeat protein